MAGPDFSTLQPVAAQPDFSTLKPVSSTPTATAKPDSFASLAIKAGKSAISSALSSLPGFGPAISAAKTLVSNAPQVATDFTTAPSEIANAFKTGVSETESGASDLLKSTNPIEGTEAGFETLGGVADTVTSPVAPVMDAAMDATGASKAIGATEDAIGSDPNVQKFAQSPAGKATARVAGDVVNVSKVLGATTIGPETADLAATAPQAAKAAPDTLASLAQTAKSKVVSTPEQQLAKVTDDWTKPTTQNVPAFNKARAALDKSPDTPRFLAQQGINPFDNIEDGKYNTADTAETLRDTAGKMSSDALRPSLQMADYTTPKTPISDIVDSAIKQVANDTDTTPGDKGTAIAHITNEAAALEKAFPDGMGLTDMHDSKITYAKNAGYSPIKDPAANVKATANRAIASALQKTVEAKAPEGIPVKAFNTYLSKYYKAADYLDTLNTKKAPVSLAQQIARGVARFGGAAVGGHFGGGIVSEFAGYQIGKALEHAAENLSNPMRASFLRNLQVTNPEAFSRVAEYMKAHAAGNPDIPRLPAARTIIPPEPSVESQMRSRASQIQKDTP